MYRFNHEEIEVLPRGISFAKKSLKVVPRGKGLAKKK
jgi:hypothetical protein